MSTTFPDGVTGPVTPGPDASDDQLAGWRDAVTSGGLPQPVQSRWQVLRAGVVNLWEFDVAEYWFADGRGQFVGANQSGKSTLMALTTLIMLAGDLGRQYVDTFGESDKSFRYYVEPTDDTRDRRDTTASTNRGWAWVEYGRIGDDGRPEYFTTLLYAQAKRGVKAMPPTWIVCRGTARVRDGLTLCEGQAVAVPAQLGSPDGLTVCDNGKHYAARLARDLFGFTDTDRYDTVLEMLKVLRTPHLGQRLNPDWFTEQMRAALPPIARAEIDELAEGWQQLEQLGRDRDTAAEARDAVAHYLAKGWRPWADAVLRLRADELLDAYTGIDGADGAVRDATGTLEAARKELTAEQAVTDGLLRQSKQAQADYEQALQSRAYQGAAQRTLNAQRLRGDAGRARDRAGELAGQADKARHARDIAEAARVAAQKTATTAGERVDAVAHLAAAKVRSAGLEDQAADWVAVGDITRLGVAIKKRKTAIPALRDLIRKSGTATGKLTVADQRATDARETFTRWQKTAGTAAAAVEAAVQALSDGIERWALGLSDAAPAAVLREQWMHAVTEQARSPRPTAVLARLIRTGWLDPAITPLTRRAATLIARAQQLRTDADGFDTEATTLASAGDPEPDRPQRWTRRIRPVFPGPDGAPLWRLIDPADGTDQSTVDHVEAALDAAGLLDAWVTPDRVWLADRDGDDTIVTLPETAPVGPALDTVVQPAEDAGALGPAVARLLALIGFTVGSGPLTGLVAIAGDGRWQTPVAAGRAAPGSHGAELLGVAARAAARRRTIADLREKAEQARAEAALAQDGAEQLQERITEFTTAADQAPQDADVIRDTITSANAHRELDNAETQLRRREGERADAQEKVDLANTEMLRFASEYRLPSREDLLDKVGIDLDNAVEAVAELQNAITERAGADLQHRSAGQAAGKAEIDLGNADREHLDAAEKAATADLLATKAEQSVNDDDQQQLARVKQLAADRDGLSNRVEASRAEGSRLAEQAVRADQILTGARKTQAEAQDRGAIAVQNWWIPVDAGLAAARGISIGEDRTPAAARAQAQTAAQTLRPPQWPDTGEEKSRRVDMALQKALGTELITLRTVLESYGGRSVLTIDPEAAGGLTAVAIVVDASGTQLSPADAIEHLDDLVVRLTRSHDEKMHDIFTELLSSTFVDHLRDRLKAVIRLLDLVNDVLGRHPTGANRTTMQLRRTAAEGQRPAYEILRTLQHGSVESDTVQEQIRTFLAERIREAQDAGHTGPQEWTDHLAELLDYRRWFDVVADYRVGDAKFQPFTKQVHGVDSGGGKVVTLLQPLLATLVALYEESAIAPRPLWLDEAFVGVDPDNRAAMLELLVDFRLDFLLAGPSPLVAAAQVPSAALWFISRAPAPAAGVDLSLMLWAGNTLQRVPVADMAARTFTPKPAAADAGPDLFTVLTADIAADTVIDSGDLDTGDADASHLTAGTDAELGDDGRTGADLQDGPFADEDPQ
ncbi:SbcC/MukB-like Walker B domain-containing protein [Actinoplanes sp. NPDC026670]|uniref:SbcC/MukB-like Walker B domain-containing protein n=1 Tax=Actinoplanes sp. NPDC026670 TaxID=3154700 RepID=UPI0033DEC1B0